MIQIIILFKSDSIALWNYILSSFYYQLISKIMRKSIHTSNKQMLTAYNLYTNCSYSEALSMFENILSQTTSIELRKNLTCTISTISLAMGNYNYALDILESN